MNLESTIYDKYAKDEVELSEKVGMAAHLPVYVVFLMSILPDGRTV